MTVELHTGPVKAAQLFTGTTADIDDATIVLVKDEGPYVLSQLLECG